MNKHILLTILISSVALNAMDVPRSNAANPATRILVLSEEESLGLAIALSKREEQERQHNQQIIDKELELAMVLSRQEAMEANCVSHAEGFNTLANNHAQPAKQYDLTNPHSVIEWAKSQGIVMTFDDALTFAFQQRDQLVHNKPVKDYDLTDPNHVLEWARLQGQRMSLQEALIFASHQQNQQVDVMLATEIASNENTPKEVIKADSKESVDECPLCLEELEDNVVPVGPNCKHKVHSSCLTEHKTKYTNCPVCRANL